MRRQEKELTDRELLDRIIQQTEFCHLACCLEDRPYLIPLSFGYDGQAIYLHTAPEGKKIRIFEENPRVSLSFVSQADPVTSPDRACKWSYAFSSAYAEGSIHEILDREGKIAAINQIMLHYSGREWEIDPGKLTGTRVWKIALETITGKVSPPPS